MDLIRTKDNSVPHGAVTGHFAGVQGIPIRFARWRPRNQQPRGTVCLFNGRGEFIEKYFETITELLKRKFAVATMDWRGQGGSGRMLDNARKGFVDSFEDYDADLFRFMQQVVLPDCPPPYFGLGHSTGAHILLRAVRTRSSWLERIVLVSPLIQLAPGLLPQSLLYHVAEALAFLGVGTSYVPGGGDSPSETVPLARSVLTKDPFRHARNAKILEDAPQLALGSPTIQWFYAACQSMAEFTRPDFPQTINVPLIAFGAGNDKVVSVRAIERLVGQLRVASYLQIPGAEHEILMERDSIRDAFWAGFDAFIPGMPVPQGRQRA